MFQKVKAAAHRRDWLAGRLAAKKLIQRFFRERAGLELALSQIEITNDEHGAPVVTSPLALPISVAHSVGHGFAALATRGSIGVDLQQIRPVRPNLAKRALSERERAQLTDRFAEREREGLLVFWALKEAAIKAQRTRPAPPLREISVTLTELGCAEILLRDHSLTARWGRWKEFIWAVAWG
ncbi:MAG: 4'-phosphopantetheinyl transferase superfamily protein [Candidatus Bipolaricaulota bacterium]|nr:4'-phosphopantetheinyl transferase superfamily protein [Candidatus Bipolaricaulota bacterium]